MTEPKAKKGKLTLSGISSKKATEKTPSHLSERLQKKTKKALSAARKEAGKTLIRLNRQSLRLEKRAEKEAESKSNVKKRGTALALKRRGRHGNAPHSARITPAKGPVTAVASMTAFVSKENEDRKWLIIDASGQTVGRLASEIATLLRGKHKPTFTPNNDAGDFVVVINAEKVKFTANKEDDKQYYKHSGWISGLKITTPKRLRENHPEKIIFTAVKGMVPRTPLGRRQMTKLKVYAGTQHPHAAQLPVAWALRSSSSNA